MAMPALPHLVEVGCQKVAQKKGIAFVSFVRKTDLLGVDGLNADQTYLASARLGQMV